MAFFHPSSPLLMALSSEKFLKIIRSGSGLLFAILGRKRVDQIFMEWQTAGLTPDPISVFGSARKQIAGPLDESIGPALVDSA